VRITDVQIDGFGTWSDLKLDHVSDTLTVFYGPNEAGKTTLLEFVRSAFYGYSPQRRSRYLPPVSGGRAGGSVGVIGAGGQFTVKRIPGSGLSSDDLGRVEVLSSSGSRQGQHVLGTLLSGIDEAIFNNVFAVGLRELQELGTLDDTEAAAQLYKLTSGLDRVSLVDVMHQLEASRNRILAADGSQSELVELLESRDKLQTEIKESAAGGQRWGQLAAQQNRLRDEVARLEENIERMERESRAVEVGLQIREDWHKRVDVRQRLKKLGPPVELPERVVERLDDLNEQIAQHREEIEQIKRSRRVLVEEAGAQPINRRLWSRACQVEAVCEHGPWISSLEGQIKRLHEEIKESEDDLRAAWKELGLSADEMPEFTPEISHRMLATLRGPARSVQEANDRLHAARAEREDSRREAEEVSEQLQTELAETGQAELDLALEEAGHRVAMLRRRAQLEERLDKMGRHRKELEEDRHELVEEQLLPVPTLVWCGVPFILGVTLVLASFFWEGVRNLGWMVTIVGFVCWGIAIVTKLLMERSMSRDLDDCIRQLDKVKKQIVKLKEERDELDEQLPKGEGPLDARITAAEEYVQKLEELTPLETRRQSALARGKAAKDKVTKAADDLRDSRGRWRDALRSVNLPESFLPEHIQQLSEGNDRTVQIGRRLQARREELRDRENELFSITERVDKLLDEVEITTARDDPRAGLRQVSAAMTEQRGWIERRQELKQEHRELKKSFRENARHLRLLVRQRHVLISQSQANDENELRRLAAKQEKIERLTSEDKELTERITIAIGSQCSEEAVSEVLETHGDDKLEQYWDRLLGRVQEAQNRLTGLHQTRGEIVQEMKTLAEDRRLPEAKLELACIEEQIRRATRRWRLLAVTSLMLEAIRQIYETERQPETLAEASGYLYHLTGGRYGRIWTPLSEDILRVNNTDGESLPLDVLSQGTREAVFLALRLALAAAFARRGALLPLVLDDVLVNFDNRRAKAAAEVLRDFCYTGHQILLFTCHRHMMELFQAANVEVRVLPLHERLCEPEFSEDDSVEVEVVEPELVEEPKTDPEEEAEDAKAEEEEVVAEDVDMKEEAAAEDIAEEDQVDVEEPVDEVHETAEERALDDEDSLWEEDEELRLADAEPDDAACQDIIPPLQTNVRWWEADIDDPVYNRKAVG